jgi:hypothetical protein
MVFCYDVEGANKWSYEFQDSTSCAYGHPVTLDANGNLYIAGGKGTVGMWWGQGSNKAFLLNLRSEGTQLWSREYNAKGIYKDAALSMEIDSQGNIFICGTTCNDRFRPRIDGHLIILKYDPLGNLLWEYIDEQTSISRAKMKSGPNGSIYLLYTKDQKDNDNNFYQTTVLLNNFDTNGNLKWTTVFQPPEYVWLELKDILFNPAGDVYIILERSGPDTTSAVLLQKFSSIGNLHWSKELSGMKTTGIRFAVVDNNSNLYFTVLDPNNLNSFLILKYNSSGSEIWNKSYLDPHGYTCSPTGLVSDIGSIIITGSCWSESNPGDFLTVKYDTDGNQEWIKQFDGSYHGADYAQDILIDVNGNVFVGGTSDSSGTGLVTLVSYDNQGNQRWVQQTRGGWWGMYLNENGEIIVIDNDGELITNMFSNDGSFLRSSRYILPAWRIKAIDFDHLYHLYITANNEHWEGKMHGGSLIASVMSTFQYDLYPSYVENPSNHQTKTFVLKQNYPNPFNPNTTIEFSLPKTEWVTLNIFNILGQQVASLVSEKLNPGIHKYQWQAENLPSGIYYCRMQAGEFEQVRKMILLK